MVSEAIDFRYLLIDNYKRLKISEEELAVLLVIDLLIGQGNPFITADILSLKMTLKSSEIDKILATLLKKGLIDYVTKGKNTVTTLEPLTAKLYREFQVSFNREQEANSNKDTKEMLENIYAVFQQLLGRALSPVEIAKIGEWVSYGYSDEMIIAALKEALSKGKKSLRSVEKILLQWQARDDIESDGHTTVSEDWDKNLEETIRIAKTPWIDDDDDK